MKTATTIRTTCPRDCYDACGMLVKTSADGTINVVGDPEHNVSRGALCGKCSIGYNGVWRDPSMRLTRPLKRVGPKGTGRFEPSELGRGARRHRQSSQHDPRQRRRRGDLADPLHRNLLADRRHLSLAVLQPHRRDRGRPGYGVQQGRARGAAVDVRRIDARLRPAHHRRLELRDDLGRQSVDLGAACRTNIGSPRRPRPRSSSIRFATRRRRRPTCICSSTRAPTARSPSPCCMPSGRQAASIGPSSPRTRRAGRRSKVNWLRALRPGAKPSPACRRASSRRRRSSTRQDRRCCGWGRVSSASPSAAMPCARSGSCPRPPATSADTGPVSSISTAGTRAASMPAI